MYHRIINTLQDFFGISRKEARGALVVMGFCMAIIWSPFVFRRWVLPRVPLQSQPIEMQVLDSIALLIESRRNSNSTHLGPRSEENVSSAKHTLFDFDPNQSTVEELAALGIPAFLVRRIDKFRSKGGRFRTSADLMKIYDFPKSLFTRLQRHIVITYGDKVPAEAARQPPPRYPKTQDRFVSAPATFDINQCDTTQLIRLKGIGNKLAQRIIKFRDALGGFYSSDQFGEIYGLDSLALTELRRHGRVVSGVKKINVNTATAEELGRHSYLRNRKMVSVLINYRNQHGPFLSLESLRDVKVIDEQTLQKIGPYLSF